MTNLIWTLIKPSNVLLYCLVVGALLSRFTFGRRLLLGGILWMAVASTVAVGGLAIGPLDRRFPRPALPESVDGIVVLAGAELPDLSLYYDEPQFNRYTDRLTSFLMLAHRFPEARLMHSGRGLQVGASQTDVARRLILGTGIDPERMMFEDRSLNTCESAIYARELARPAPGSRWVLVTSAHHMPRAVACFRAVDWTVLPYPTDYKSAPGFWFFSLLDNLRTFDMAVHEWLGLVYYRLTGRTKELFPSP